MKKLLLFLVVFLAINVFTFSQKTVVWSEDFESNPLVRWNVASGTWEMGVPTGLPSPAHGGTQCAATILNGDYTANVDSRLVCLNYFTVPDGSENPQLRLWHWYSFASGDYGIVQIHVQGTANTEWINLSGSYLGYEGNIWTEPYLDLSPYSGKSVQLGFYFHSDGYNGGPGWYIDDISVVTGPITFSLPETWENGFGDWYPDYGVWQVGTPTVGPGSAHGGSNCAASSLSGNYYANLDSKLISPSFLVPEAIRSPYLRFWHWYTFASGDFGKVLIKVEGNSDWEELPQGGYTSNGGNIWSFPALDLSNYAGKKVRLALYFHSDGYNQGPGWYVDDIQIQTIATAINDNVVEKGELLKIYPNPASDIFNIEFPNLGIDHINITLYSIFGKPVLQLNNIPDQRVEIQKGTLPPGIYFVKVNEVTNYTGKIIIR